MSKSSLRSFIGRSLSESLVSQIFLTSSSSAPLDEGLRLSQQVRQTPPPQLSDEETMEYLNKIYLLAVEAASAGGGSSSEPLARIDDVCLMSLSVSEENRGGFLQTPREWQLLIQSKETAA